jgi:hypothetical protein
VLTCAVVIFGLVNVWLVLDSVSRHQREMRRVLYLAASGSHPRFTAGESERDTWAERAPA